MTRVSDATTTPGAGRRACGPCNALGIVCVPLRLALGGLFVMAAYNKLFIPNGPQLFSTSIEAFKIFDPQTQGRLIQIGTFVMPWIELLAGLAVVLGVFTRAAALVLGSLLVFFIGLIASALLRGLNVKCGCFGSFSPFCPEQLGMCNIHQDAAMLLAAVAIMATTRHACALERLRRRTIEA